MKRLLSLAVIASLVINPAAHAAPKKIAVKPMQLVTTVGTPEEVSGVVVSGKSLVVSAQKLQRLMHERWIQLAKSCGIYR